MFWLKKTQPRPIQDLVFASRQAKWQALAMAAKKQPAPVIIAWFDASLEDLGAYFLSLGISNEIISYRQLPEGSREPQHFIFIEHYPLAKKEHELFNRLENDEVTIYSSLDEPFFKYFGGDKIVALLTKMGIAENEGISHRLISKAVRQAQEKLAGKILIEHTARSGEEWLRLNTGM